MKITSTLNGSGQRSLRKILTIMRLSVLLLTVTILQTFAAGSYAQNTRLTVNFEEAPLAEALSEFEDNSEFFFLYNENLIDTHRKVSFSAMNLSINELLDRLFNGTDVQYSIVDRKIVLAPETIDLAPQQLEVSGSVKDEEGLPLPGVTILLKGSGTGTISDLNGKFTLTIPNAEGQVLVFSYIGMKTMEVPVVPGQALDVVMQMETIGFDGVVITALGIRRQEKALGYAVQSVSAEGIQTVKGVDIGHSQVK